MRSGVHTFCPLEAATEEIQLLIGLQISILLKGSDLKNIFLLFVLQLFPTKLLTDTCFWKKVLTVSTESFITSFIEGPLYDIVDSC